MQILFTGDERGKRILSQYQEIRLVKDATVRNWEIFETGLKTVGEIILMKYVIFHLLLFRHDPRPHKLVT